MGHWGTGQSHHLPTVVTNQLHRSFALQRRDEEVEEVEEEEEEVEEEVEEEGISISQQETHTCTRITV